MNRTETARRCPEGNSEKRAVLDQRVLAAPIANVPAQLARLRSCDCCLDVMCPPVLELSRCHEAPRLEIGVVDIPTALLSHQPRRHQPNHNHWGQR